ncbi:MAG: hypothetical protein R2692_00820 [Microbacterium sp.]
MVGDRRFLVDAGGFWQVHRPAAATLTAAVRDALETAGASTWPRTTSTCTAGWACSRRRSPKQAAPERA